VGFLFQSAMMTPASALMPFPKLRTRWLLFRTVSNGCLYELPMGWNGREEKKKEKKKRKAHSSPSICRWVFTVV
jgi:hypothetical protein